MLIRSNFTIMHKIIIFLINLHFVLKSSVCAELFLYITQI